METLATELLHEIKSSARRWFVIAMVELCIIIGLGIGILWYLSLPAETVETEYSQEMEMDDMENSTATQVIGGNYNGKDETDLQEDIQEKNSQE